MTIGNREKLPVIDHLSYSSVTTYQTLSFAMVFPIRGKNPRGGDWLSTRFRICGTQWNRTTFPNATGNR